MSSGSSRRGPALVLLWIALLSQPAATAAPTLEPERHYDTEHFRVTWIHDRKSPDAPSLRDVDASGVPDSIERVAAAFEEARARLLVDLAYRPPPVTGRYLIYIAQAEGRPYTRPAPGDRDRSKASFVVLPPLFARTTTTIRQIRSVAVHEYFHAIQMGYDWLEPLWFDEATAAWVQDIAFDGDDTNHYLVNHFVPYPRRSLTEADGRHEYGAFIFVQFLMERYGGAEGPAIVREMWELMAVADAIPGAPDLDALGALAEVLRERGLTVGEAWREFLVWRWRLDHFEEGRAYRAALEESSRPRLLRSTTVDTESCRLTTRDGSLQPLPRLSGDYVRLRPGTTLEGEHEGYLTVSGSPGAVATALLKDASGVVSEIPLAFDASGLAKAVLPFGRTQTKKLTLALGNGSVIGPALELAYSLRVAGRDATVVSPVFGPGMNVFGEGIFLDGTVSCGGLAAPQAQVQLVRTEIASGAEHVVELVTDELGRWSAHVAPTSNSTFRLELADALLSEEVSPDKRVDVALKVDIDPAAEHVRLGESLDVNGTALPVHPGAEVVLEFRRPERTWRFAASTVSDDEGRFGGTVLLPDEGFWEVRARVVATNDLDHVPGTSLAHLIQVGP